MRRSLAKPPTLYVGAPRPAGPQPRDGLPRARPFHGWIVIAVAFVTMGIGVNARTVFSLLFPPILDEFSWPRGLTAGAFSFGFLVSGILGPVLSRLIDRRDRTGDYVLAFWLSIGASLASAAAIWLAAPRHVRAVAGRVPRGL